MVNWDDDEEEAIVVIDNTPKPKRVVKVRDPQTEGLDAVKHKVELGKLQIALDHANARIQTYLTRIYDLEQQTQQPTENTSAKILLSSVIRRISRLKMNGKVSNLDDLNRVLEML